MAHAQTSKCSSLVIHSRHPVPIQTSTHLNSVEEGLLLRPGHVGGRLGKKALIDLQGHNKGERPCAPNFSQPCMMPQFLNETCTIRTLISEGRALLTTACLLASRSFKTSRTSALLSRPPSLSTLSKRERVLSVKHHDSTSLWHARALLDSLGALTSSSIHSGPRSSSCGQEGEYSKKSSDLVVPNSRRILKLCQKYYAGF